MPQNLNPMFKGQTVADWGSDQASQPTLHRRGRGRILGGVAAAVFVLAAALIGGFFLGRDSVPVVTPQQQADNYATQETGSRLRASIAADSSVTITPELLAATGSNPAGHQAVAQAFRNGLGASQLQLHNAAISTAMNDDTGLVSTQVSGTTSLHGLPCSVVASIRHVAGSVQLVAEHYPSTSEYSLHDMAGISSSTALPVVNQDATAFVLANYAGEHAMAGPAAPRPSVNVQPGLNIVSSMTPNDNPALEALFATTAPAGPAARRLAASGTRSSPLPANAITDLDSIESQWYNKMKVDIEGLVRPTVKIGSVALPSILFNKNLNINNGTIHSPSQNGVFDFSGSSTLSLSGCAPVTVAISGSISTSSYKFTGKLSQMTLGKSASSSALIVQDVVVTASGGMGPAMPKKSATYKTTVSGNVVLSSVKAAFNVALPLADSGSMTFSVDDLALDKNVILQQSTVTVTDNSVAASATVSIDSHAESGPIDIQASFNFDQGMYFISGSLDNWEMPLGDGVLLKNLQLDVSGPAGPASSPSPVAEPEYALSVAAEAIIEGVDVSVSLTLPATGLQGSPLSQPTTQAVTQPASKPMSGTSTERGVTFKLSVSDASQFNVQKSLDATVGSGATPLANAPVASGMLSHVKDVSFESLDLEFTTFPPALVAKAELDIFGMNNLNLEFVAQRVSCDWEFGFGVALESSFKFSDLVPSDTGFDYIPFATGMVVVSTSNATFTMAVGDSDATLAVEEGVALTATIPFKQLSEKLVDDGTWKGVESATVTGSFGFSTHDLKFNATLPPNLPLSKDITLTRGSVMMSSAEPHFGLQAAAKLTYSSTEAPLDISLAGTLGDTAFALVGSVAEWHIGAESSGLEITKASVTLDGTKATATDPWSITGKVSGDLKFGSVILEAVVDLPVNKDHIDVQVPELQLSKGVRLTDMDLDLSSSGSTTSYTFAASAAITMPEFDLSAQVSGSVDNGVISVSGTIPTWNIGGANGLKCTDVAFSMSGHQASSTEAMHLTGTLSGDVDFFGVHATFSADLPLANTGQITIGVSDLHLASDITLTKVSVTINEAAAEKYTFVADASVGTGLKADAMTLSVTGGLDPSTGSFSVDGSLANFDLGNDFSIQEVTVHLNGTRKSGGGIDLGGTLKGDMAFDNVHVDVEAVLPTESLTITFPSLRISHDVLLTDVSMTVQQAAPHYSFTATAGITTGLKTPLSLTVDGTINDKTFTIDAELTNWSIEVGHKNLEAESLELHLVDTLGGGHMSGTLSGTVAFAPMTLDMSIAIPADAEGGMTIDLTLQDGDTLSMAKAVSTTCGTAALAGTKAPGSTMGQVQDKDIANAKIQIVTKPPAFQFTGTVDAFGEGGLAVQFIAKQLPSSTTWGYSFGVSISNALKFSQVVPDQTGFDDLPFAAAGVVISTMETSYTFSSSLGTVTTIDGVTFKADLPVAHLKAQLPAVERINPADNDVVVAGSFGFSTDALTLTASLPDNLPLGSHMVVNGSIIIATTLPKYTIKASATIDFHADVDSLTCDVDITFGDDGAWHVTGTATDYKFHIGHEGLSASSVTVTLSDGGSTEFEGTLKGVIPFTKEKIDLTFEFDVPTPNDANGGMTFKLGLEPGSSVSFGQAIEATTGASDIKLPSDFTQVSSNRLLSGEFVVSTNPPTFSATGTMSLFHFDHPLTVKLQVGDDGHGWQYGIGVGIDEPFGIGDVMASHSSSKANKFRFESGGIVFTDSDAGFSLDLGAGNTVTMTDGIAIQGEMGLSQGHLSTVSKWAKTDALIMKASFAFDSKDFRIEADLDADWHIGSHVAVTQASLFMDIGGPNGFDLGIACALAATIGHSHPQTLDFSSSIMFTLDSLQFTAAMNTPWNDPFGTHGVTIGDTEIMLGISYVGVPDAFGFSGSLIIGSESGSATIYVNAADPSSTVIAGSLSYFNLGTMLEKLTDNIIPSFLAKTVLDVGFTDLSLELNLGTTALHFNHQVFEPGFRFSVKQFVMWGITGACDIEIGSRNFFLNATVNPIHVGNNGDILSLSGYGCSTCPAQMLIAFGTAHLPGEIKISAQGDLLGIVKADADVSISDKGFLVDLMFSDGIFEFIFNLQAGVGKPSDFSLYAAMEQKLLDFIGTKVVGFLKEAKDSADSKIDEAKAKVNDWEENKLPILNHNKALIAQYKSEDQAKFNDAEAKLRDANSKLSGARAHVNDLQNEINSDENDKEHCRHWYDARCHSHNAWLDTKIAALWVAKHAADAALDVASAAVHAAEGGVDAADHVVENVDPRVVALETANAAIEVAGKAADAGLDAAKGLTNGVLDSLEFTAEALAKTFNIEKVWISAGSVAGIKNGGKVSCGMQGIIVGKSFNWDLSIDFPPKADDLVSQAWDNVKKEIHI